MILLLPACSDGTTSSGSMATVGQAALGLAGGALVGTELAKRYKHGGEDAVPPAVPLMPEDLEAIARAGPHLDACSRIFRTDVASFQGVVTTGANLWRPGLECSLGPGTVEASVELRARKLIHEACHARFAPGDDASANACEREISTELGLL